MKNIFHAPTSTGGQSQGLAAAEKQMGFASTIIAKSDLLEYSADQYLSSHGILQRLQLLNKLRKHADLIHFNYGSTLIDPPTRHAFMLDLPFYRSDTVKVMTWQGSDGRLRYPERIAESRRVEQELGHEIRTGTAGGTISPQEMDLKKRRAAKARRHTNHQFVLNPDLLELIPDAEWLPYATARRPDEMRPRSLEPGRPVRIVHMATNRVLKGTGMIEKAMRTLARDIEIDFQLVEGQPHDVAQALLDRADICVDQMCLGWYGAQAVEAMARGIPVFVNLDASWVNAHLGGEIGGMITATPDTLAARMLDFLQTPGAYAAASERAIAFACRWHDPVSVATRVFDAIGWAAGQTYSQVMQD
jgi:hypothetical protein